tara:strand:+ start:472 stop:669 length:198 start_codon:yes stop_codon:yes gene_type:complete
MFGLIHTVNSISLVAQSMGFTKAFRKYRNEHSTINIISKYDIPSLIWPPPKSIFCLAVNGGIAHG